MAELIENNLLGGEEFKIWKVDCTQALPEDARLLRFILATTAYENPYGGRRDLSYWRIYFTDAFKRANLPEVRDYFYLAEVNGTLAARLWFAYSTKNHFGNFGNIFTLPEFRRRGILRRMMPHCIRDFEASPAYCLACATGSEFAARTYMDYGFELVYGGTAGTMALVKKSHGSFSELDTGLLSDVKTVNCRPGTLGDQFIVDKFLRYDRDFHAREIFGQLLDFRCCSLETRNGNGTLSVAENASGAITGFAWGGSVNGIRRLSYLIHPRTTKEDGAMLLRHLVSQCSDPLLCFRRKDDAFGAMLLKEAGARIIDTLPDGTDIMRLQ